MTVDSSRSGHSRARENPESAVVANESCVGILASPRNGALLIGSLILKVGFPRAREWTCDRGLAGSGGRWVSTDQTEPGKWIISGGLRKSPIARVENCPALEFSSGFFPFRKPAGLGYDLTMETDVIVKIVVIGSVIVAAGLYFFLYR